jgi:hypothetical protein
MTQPTHGLDPNALEAALHKLRRTLEMQANIMRDPVRTGAWEGADRVANAFASAAEKVAEIEGTVTQKQVAQDFDDWWSLDGQYIDPDTDDVPWFDKRRGLAMAAFQAGGKSQPDFKRMVERFLTWKLPEDFNPDGGVHFEPYGNLGTPHEYRRKPTGTNLFNATQAEAMVRYMLDGLPKSLQTDAEQDVVAAAQPSSSAEETSIEWPMPDAYVVWYEPSPSDRPTGKKIIDASLAVMDRAEIGDSFYSHDQMRLIVRLYCASATAQMRGALHTIINTLVFPVSSEIDAKGWSLQTPNEDRNTFAVETALAALSQNPGTSNMSGEAVAISVKTMKLSDGREDHYVSIRVGDREITPHKYSIKGRAEFDVAEWNWLLNGAEKPDVVDWLDRTRPLVALEARASDRERTIEECAKVADGFVDPVDPDFARRRPDEAANFERDNDTARRLATAIRKLSEVSHEH